MTAFVFLIGNGRSGSTLVHELLARHGGVGFISNLEDRFPCLPPAAGRYNNALYRRVPPALTRKGRPRNAPSEAYRSLSRQVSPMIANSSRDLLASDAMRWVARRFQSFFSDRALVQGKPLFLHKFTGWPRTGFVRAVFPDARFVHLVRDGRAVVASEIRTSWWGGYMGPEHLGVGPLPSAYAKEWEASGRSFPVLSAESWKIVMDAHVEARALVPRDQWLDVRFEDILADPHARFREMLEFMGLEDDGAFATALARTSFSADRRDAFRRDLDAATIAKLKASLADHVRAVGL